MERAGSIHTGHIWNAVDFQHADDDVRALHRSQGNGFRCVDCGGESWLVKRSANTSARFAGHHPSTPLGILTCAHHGTAMGSWRAR